MEATGIKQARSSAARLALSGLLVLLITPAPAWSGVTAEDLLHHRRASAESATESLWRASGGDARAALAHFNERQKERDTVSIVRDAFNAARLAVIANKRAFAVALADAAFQRYLTPAGTFVEYDRASWLKREELWRTIPWGTNFRGNLALDVYQLLKDDLSPSQRAAWTAGFNKMGAWIHKNPVAGTFVFNSVIDLCRLLWRLGREFDNKEWQQWAMQAAAERIRRDVDQEGWIQGENGGCSGSYQNVGAGLLAQFAWESKDPLLEQTLLRVFRAMAAYSPESLAWAGNFGTRSSGLGHINGTIVLEAAALGDPHARWLVDRFGRPDWSDDPQWWAAAQNGPRHPPTHKAVQDFTGIQTTVTREGPWVAYISNYDRSIWSRGFINLWHAKHGDWLFSTLHSLPSSVEKAKLHIGDTSDWSGFPHVRVFSGASQFDSHQKVSGLKTQAGPGLNVSWSEALSDRSGAAGGTMRSDLTLDKDDLILRVDLAGLAGRSQVDFHMLKRPSAFVGLWTGDAVSQIAKGQLPSSGGLFRDRVFKAREERHFAIQVDNSVFAFELLEVPEQATITLGAEALRGLNTSDLGGFRLRIDVPESLRAYVLRLKLRLVNR